MFACPDGNLSQSLARGPLACDGTKVRWGLEAAGSTTGIANIRSAPDMKVSRSASLFGVTLLLCVAAVLGACATANAPPKLKVRTNVDPEAKFDTYRSYGFVAEPGTNIDGKTTPLTIYFMQAIRQEMDSRGYSYTEESPDLLVNFHTNGSVSNKHTQVTPTYGYSTGYYAYRAGLYGLPVVMAEGQETITYRMGTGNVDVVDAHRKILAWEGIAEGGLSEEMIANPGPAIGKVISDMFAQYPGKAPR